MGTDGTKPDQEVGGKSLPLPKRPTRTPIERRFIIAYWCVVAAVGAGVLARLIAATLYPISAFDAITSGIGLSVPLVIVYLGGREFIGRRFLRPHGGFICPRCHYTLRDLPDFGTCPECGTRYTRAGVVELWEKWFGIRRLYPRLSPLSSDDLAERRAAGIELIKAESSGLPWVGCRLQCALQQVEAAARRNGCRSGRFPAYLLGMERPPATPHRPLPPDLYAFFAWIDPEMWSWLVNPNRSIQGSGSESEKADWVTGGPFRTGPESEMRANPVILRPPEFFRFCPPSVLGPGETSRVVVATESAPSPGDDAPMPIEFADATGAGIVVYCLGTDAFNDGAIIATLPTGESLWLAASLSEWLARLAACVGAEPCLNPSLIERMPSDLRTEFARRFREHNPGRHEFASLL